MYILENKYYNEESVFKPDNLLREAKRQKNKPDCKVPAICLLDPDGDLTDYLLKNVKAIKNNCWACYHSSLYNFHLTANELGILPCVVGSSYAVLVAEQLFVSGCKLIISVTSAGVICDPGDVRRFVLIESSIRDEGTSYHYISPEKPARLDSHLLALLKMQENNLTNPYFIGKSWTTDAPFRETSSAIGEMKKNNISCVEMEAAALYALSEAKHYNILCFAHLTNSMAQQQGDFEKGEEFGSIATLKLVSHVIQILQQKNILQYSKC
jgi:uridine phosphorylase